jgi:DNA polymerase-3 subunit alpha
METKYNELYLKYLVDLGVREKYGVAPKDVLDRMEMEYSVIFDNNFTDYILMIWDIHDFCRSPARIKEFCESCGFEVPENSLIPLGPGRGSSGGSLVCYLIGIVSCDPLLFDLFFERFLNPERIAFPDIDFDVSQKYRHIVISYISNKYGDDKVSQIITFGTLSLRTVVNDVLRVAQVPLAYINKLKEVMPPSDDDMASVINIKENHRFMDALGDIPFFDTQITLDKAMAIKYKDSDAYNIYSTVIDSVIADGRSRQINVPNTWDAEKALSVMERLEGLVKNESTHAAGVVVSPISLPDKVPLFRKSGTGSPSVQYDMNSIEALGYLKMDVLGLRTVDVNAQAEMLVRKNINPMFDLNYIPYNDHAAINLINDGDTVGIFQIESTGFTEMMQGLNIGGAEVDRYRDIDISSLSTIKKKRGDEIRDFMWIAAGVAMYRPGPLDANVEGKTMVEHLIDRKAGKEPVVYLFPEEKEYLEETYGILVYQEQVMARVRAMTGCSYGRADIVRKAMGKKDPVLMKEQIDWFIESAMSHNFTNIPNNNQLRKKQIVERAANETEVFARYGFNKAHAVEYAHICYYNAYLKAHFPICFYVALLNSETSDPKRQTIIIRDMLKHDIDLLPPDVNESEIEFTQVGENIIRFGLSAIKNLGERACSTLIMDRTSRGRFESIQEFRARMPATDINVTVMTNLAKSGAFDSIMNENRATTVASMKALCDSVNKLKKTRTKNKVKITPTIDEVLVKLPVCHEITQAIDDKVEYAIWEKEILKYYISAHPIDKYVDEMRRWGSIDVMDNSELPAEFYIAGFIEEVHETTIKKEGRNFGKKMGFVGIGSVYRLYDCTMFPDIYESCLPYLKIGNPVVLKGKKNLYQDNITIQTMYIRNMVSEGIRDCPEVHINIKDKVYATELTSLRRIIDEYPGTTTIYIHIINGYNKLKIEVGPKVALGDFVISYIESIFGDISYHDQK